MERGARPGLTEGEAKGLRDALEAEHESRTEAAAAVDRFGSVPVLVHLRESTERHIEILTDLLRRHGFEPSVPTPIATAPAGSLVEALDAAFDRETRKAQLYDRLLDGSASPELRRILFNLWQAATHRHRSALAHRLRIEQEDIR